MLEEWLCSVNICWAQDSVEYRDKKIRVSVAGVVGAGAHDGGRKLVEDSVTLLV